MDSTRRGSNFSRFVWSIPFLIILIAAMPLARAADDSNSGDFTLKPHSPPTQPSTPPPVPIVLSPGQNASSQNMANGIEKLNKDSGNTDVNKLAKDIRAGNYTGANSTLTQIQSQLRDPTSPSSTQVPTTLKDVLESTSCSSTDCNVDWSKVSDLVKPYFTTDTGVPQGLAGESPGSAADQLKVLSSMASKADPSFASLLNMDVAQINQFLNSFDSYNGPLQNLQPPQLPNLSSPVGSSTAAGVVPPVGGASPGIGGVPGIGNSAGLVLVPVLTLLAGFLAYSLLRKKQGAVLGSRKLGTIGMDPVALSTVDLDPTDPRHSIVLSFRRAVAVMLGRGVLKQLFETHREFTAKCEIRPEKPFVGRISSLYERAMFSGRRITSIHAEDARRQVSLIEDCNSNLSKE